MEYEKSDNPLRYDRVIFRYKLNDERYIERDYGIDWMDRTFGRQPYFVCNKTEKRVKQLLIVEGLFRTRHEFKKMHYYSEHESVMDRHARAARRIRSKFGKDTDLMRRMDTMEKPAHLHWTTWQYWVKKEAYHYDRWLNAWYEQTQKMQKHLGIFM